MAWKEHLEWTDYVEHKLAGVLVLRTEPEEMVALMGVGTAEPDTLAEEVRQAEVQQEVVEEEEVVTEEEVGLLELAVQLAVHTVREQMKGKMRPGLQGLNLKSLVRLSQLRGKNNHS